MKLQLCKKSRIISLVVLDLNDKSISTEKYWSLEKQYMSKELNISYQEAKDELQELLISACEYRMVSDVPVGIFLSGGYDSTLVTAMLQKDASTRIKTFTIGFPDGVDEGPHAKKIAEHLGTDHTNYDCLIQDAKNIIPELSYYYDEPNADVSCIPTILVSRLVKQKVSVALSADGGDGLFGGYSGFKSYVDHLRRLRNIPLKRVVSELTSNINTLIPNSRRSLKRKLEVTSTVLQSNFNNQFQHLVEGSQGLPNAYISKIRSGTINIDMRSNEKHYYDFLDERNILFVKGIQENLEGQLLVKVDRATMSAGLEGREPLLDHRLIEYSAKLPYEFKRDGFTSKKIIKDIVHDYVPSKLMDRPKVGFDLPLNKWISEDLYYLIDEYLNIDKIKQSNVFNSSVVNEIIIEFRKGTLHYKDIIWRLVSFQMWYQRWIIDEK